MSNRSKRSGMSLGARCLIGALVAIPLALAAGLTLAGVAIYRAGTVQVEVDEPGGNQIQLAVPAVLAGVAIRLIPDGALRDAVDEAAPVVPALAAGWRELERMPDFVLVEVLSPEGNVRVEKLGRNLCIDVEAEGSDVRVTVPLRVAGSVIEKLERALLG